METFALAPALRAALERLIDFAGLFPPAELPMEDAVASYDRARASAPAWMLGRFIVPAARLVELRSMLGGRPRFELSVIAAPAAFDLVARERRANWATIGALEVPLGDASVDACAVAAEQAGLHDLPIFVESRRVSEQRQFNVLAAHGFGAKLRCGGAVPEAFPSVADVAEFIAEASAVGLAFKATAGLHHPVRSLQQLSESSAVTMHGFLNLLAAAVAAPQADATTLEAIIAEEDPTVLLRGLGNEDAVRRARERFVSYGSCSFDEPVDDLRALGVLAAG
jgi:hypothetical protein